MAVKTSKYYLEKNNSQPDFFIINAESEHTVEQADTIEKAAEFIKQLLITEMELKIKY